MKTKLTKTVKYFVSYLLPLYWVLGFAAAMTERNVYIKSNDFLFYCIRIALIIIVVSVVYDMRSHDIKGWHVFVCSVAALIIALLSFCIHFEL